MIHVFQCYSIIRHKHVLWSTYLFVSATSVGRSWKCLKCLMVLTMMLMEACLALSTSQHGHHRLAPMRKYFRFYLFLSNHLQFLHIHNNVYIYTCVSSPSLSHSVKQHFDETALLRRFFPHMFLFFHMFLLKTVEGEVSLEVLKDALQGTTSKSKRRDMKKIGQCLKTVGHI